MNLRNWTDARNISRKMISESQITNALLEAKADGIDEAIKLVAKTLKSDKDSTVLTTALTDRRNYFRSEMSK